MYMDSILSSLLTNCKRFGNRSYQKRTQYLHSPRSANAKYLNIFNKSPFTQLNNRLPIQDLKPIVYCPPPPQSPHCAALHKERLSTHHRQSLALISLDGVSRGGSGICIQRYWGLTCDLRRTGAGGISPHNGNRNSCYTVNKSCGHTLLFSGCGSLREEEEKRKRSFLPLPKHRKAGATWHSPCLRWKDTTSNPLLNSAFALINTAAVWRQWFSKACVRASNTSYGCFQISKHNFPYNPPSLFKDSLYLSDPCPYWKLVLIT